MSARERGFTLIELLLYVAMVSVMMTAIIFFWGVIEGTERKAHTISSVELQSQQMLNVMLQDIRSATAIATPAMHGTGSTLDLTSATGEHLVYTLTGNQLTLTRNAGAATALHNTDVTVSALTFTELSRTGTPQSIRVSFTTTFVNSSGRKEYSYTQTMTGTANRRATPN